MRISDWSSDVCSSYLEGIFDSQQFFVGANLRKQTQAGYADYIPVFLSETQKLIREGYLKVNVALIMVSLPDKHGYVSMGTSVDATLSSEERRVGTGGVSKCRYRRSTSN